MFEWNCFLFRKIKWWTFFDAILPIYVWVSVSFLIKDAVIWTTSKNPKILILFFTAIHPPNSTKCILITMCSQFIQAGDRSLVRRWWYWRNENSSYMLDRWLSTKLIRVILKRWKIIRAHMKWWRLAKCKRDHTDNHKVVKGYHWGLGTSLSNVVPEATWRRGKGQLLFIFLSLSKSSLCVLIGWPSIDGFG